MAKILIVDDERGIRRSLAGLLSDEGFETCEAAEGAQALAVATRGGDADGDAGAAPDLVLLDIAMPGVSGIEVLEALRRRRPQLPVIMMSGHGTIETAVRATQLGAFDFIEKPIAFEKLLLTLRHALEAQALANENRALRARNLRARAILGESKIMQTLKEQIQKAAPTNGRVLITGENGTGKEMVARHLHLNSARADAPFVEVNCAAIPEELIESELFGHEKGAFTGAITRKQGKFELADGGTIFLDEVADMSLRTQARILRILQENKFERVGGAQSLEVDVRVFAATNKNLEREIEAGNFRRDLYYRLNVIPFRVPSLRERREDIPQLVSAFVREFCAESGAGEKRIADGVLQRLRAYHWPGNVRELRNLMERLVLMSPGVEIVAEDLPSEVLRGDARATTGRATLADARREFERDFLLACLKENDGNVARAAAALGMARESLSRKLKAVGLR